MKIILLRQNRIEGQAGDIVDVSPARADFLIRYGLGATRNREREQTPEDAIRTETPEDVEPKETPEKRKNNTKNKKTTK